MQISPQKEGLALKRNRRWKRTHPKYIS